MKTKLRKKDRKANAKKATEQVIKVDASENENVAVEVAPDITTANNGASDHEAPDTSPVVASFEPYDAEAWAWMWTPITGAHCPILYVGWTTSVKLSKMLGRSMTIDEAQHLVKLDGEMVKCALTGELFQPVKYLGYITQQIEDDIKDGKALTEIPIRYGGAFYAGEKEEPIGYSGKVFRYNKATQTYDTDYSEENKLVELAEAMKDMYGKRYWGVSYERATKKLMIKAERKNIRNDIAAGKIKPVGVFGRQLRDAFHRAKR